MQLEQWESITFCVKLGKTATETSQFLCDVHGGHEALSQPQVSEWHRETMEDDMDQAGPWVQEMMTMWFTLEKCACWQLPWTSVKSTCYWILWEDLCSLWTSAHPIFLQLNVSMARDVGFSATCCHLPKVTHTYVTNPSESLNIMVHHMAWKKC